MSANSHKRGTGLQHVMSPLCAWAFSVGTSIGWGSFIVTCSTYLQKAGTIGTAAGLVLGMLIILVIAWNLQYMICQAPNAAGIYNFTKTVNGNDYGFLAGWFIMMTYFAILWANITSLPLFARFFLGDTFRFGFHYTIFGYEVYLGEALLSIAAVVIIGLICANSARIPNTIMTASVLLFVAGISFTAILSLFFHSSSFSFEPAFMPDSLAYAQIVKIAAISPWAFIGFENVSHFSEEYSFPVKKIRNILIASVVVTTVLYILISLLSVSAYPPEYASWFEYIQDMGNLEGIKAVPAFYAADHYMGRAGVAILMVSLFGVILSSLIGNMLALSRLIYASTRDSQSDSKMSRLNRSQVPGAAICFIVALSVIIPFLGRTAIGWIVDVTTLGATILYAMISQAVYKHAKLSGRRAETVTGMAGIVLMIVYIMLLLFPSLLSFDAMATESYFLFNIWAVIGLFFFGRLVRKDTEQRYGHSVIVWVILLLLMLFSSMMWVSRITGSATDKAMAEIFEFHKLHGAAAESDTEVLEFLSSKAQYINNTNALFTVVSFFLFIISTAIIMVNFSAKQRIAQQLSAVKSRASTDALTGVKNRLSYAQFEADLNSRIDSDSVDAFGIVVCDLNNLKYVNDTYGHKRGDEYIRSECMLVCKVFKHSPVFRIGGDEFVVLLKGHDYDMRHELMEELRDMSLKHCDLGCASIAAGMSEYRRGEDLSVLHVFTRADRIMYEEKKRLKTQKTLP